MKLSDRRLDEWLSRAPKGKSGREKSDFARRYTNLAGRLAGAHTFAVTGAVAADARAQDARGEVVDPGILTNHGPEHIEKVIEHATSLLRTPDADLSPREVFMLLVGIQLHDVGNAYGRERHEERVWDVLRQVRSDDLDEVETRAICQIVQAHGGLAPDGSKDRIGPIYPTQNIFGQPVRLQLLAAILRFADELADDYSRAARFLMAAGGLPKKSEIYHEYAKSLRSVIVNAAGREIALTYVLDRRVTMNKVGRDDREEFLLDYILGRTQKMHYERVYCSRFMAPHGIQIDQIRIEIMFLDDDGRDFHAPIHYRLEDRGYPTEQPLGDLCADDLRAPGTRDLWCGALVKDRLERGEQND
ncbi:MAG: hypothetical protein JWM27_2802 [Gemmatimonadetes bacterium]|nr:hypothetical protein [Gemmatimonadota bacterium]